MGGCGVKGRVWRAGVGMEGVGMEGVGREGWGGKGGGGREGWGRRDGVGKWHGSVGGDASVGMSGGYESVYVYWWCMRWKFFSVIVR